MKQIICLIALLFAVLSGSGQVVAQSDYNLRKAAELMENGDYVEAMRDSYICIRKNMARLCLI